MSAEERLTLPARLSRRLAIEINMSRSGHMYWNGLPGGCRGKSSVATYRARHEAASRPADMIGGAVLVVTQ